DSTLAQPAFKEKELSPYGIGHLFGSAFRLMLARFRFFKHPNILPRGRRNSWTGRQSSAISNSHHDLTRALLVDTSAAWLSTNLSGASQFQIQPAGSREGRRAVSKHDRLAYGVMLSGVALGIVLAGRAGFICGAISVLAGPVWIIISSAKHGGSDAHEKTEILVLVQEAHARALPQNDSDFHVFLRVSLTNRTQFDLGIREIQLTITASDSSSHWSGLCSPRLADRISGDLDKWHLGKEREHTNTWNGNGQTRRESMPELNAAEPVKVGITRVGWLHFRLRNITPEEFRTAPMELSVEDALSHKHVAALLSCPRHLPGKVW